MNTKKLLMHIHYFHFLASIGFRDLLPKLMLMFGSFLWACFCSFVFDLLGLITKFIFRLKSNYANNGENVENFIAIHSLSDDHTVKSSCEVSNYDGFEENEKDINQNRGETEYSVSKKDEENEKDFNKNRVKTEDFVSKKDEKDFNQNRGETEYSVFKKDEENEKDFNQNRVETEYSVFKEDELISSESKYQFLPRKNISSFIIEPKVIRLTVEEMFVGSNGFDIPSGVLQFQSKEGFGVFDERSNDSSVYQGSSNNVSEKFDEFFGNSCFEENPHRTEEVEEESVIEFKTIEGESREITNSSEQMNLETSTSTDEIEIENFNKHTGADGGSFEGGTIVCRQEQDHVKKCFQENVSKFEGPCEVLDIYRTSQEFEEKLQNFEETPNGNLEDTDHEDADEFDILQEHKYLVKKMKMEMRYSKMKGLPTISEEYESQKTLVYDLKPLNIAQKLGYKDHMAEIQMFYGCYAQRMKKLDILNSQTLHAMSLLHLKNSKALMGCKKSPISFIKPYIPKSWPYKQHKIYADSTSKLASVMHHDLELVYIGQVCNSWEILNWQYSKAKDLLEFDSDQRHQLSYSKVASECQQFEVLLERFLEDEAFHGPRILHYVKNRCIFRTLLQIPVIKEDCLKERKATKVEDGQINVSLVELADMIKKSMNVFWEFLRIEKTTSKMKSKARTEVDKHDPSKAKLLKDIRLNLQQKERRLKDIVRSKTCIVKKFQKHQNGAQNHEVFASQVEMKLVERVLCLTKISTNQIMWCQKKLDGISFLGRNVHVEHSFFLFPC